MDQIDLRGKPCPIPVIEVKKFLAAAPSGTGLVVLVDNDTARRNIQKFTESKGYGLAHEATPEGDIRITLTAGLSPAPTCDGETGGLVVAVGAESMGRGDDDLGRALIKSFIFSLTELDVQPEAVIFFNGGVRLTCEGSAALDDLDALAAKGVAIHSCGACLNHYGLTESLRVGGVSNMYAIVDAMARAKRVINI